MMKQCSQTPEEAGNISAQPDDRVKHSLSEATTVSTCSHLRNSGSDTDSMPDYSTIPHTAYQDFQYAYPKYPNYPGSSEEDFSPVDFSPVAGHFIHHHDGLFHLPIPVSPKVPVYPDYYEE
eukprot:GHVO01011730.1.p1 GENE.GHVO01011730.1~~GHVO01011730.1.p1  ORF type:complete len:121 (+),score=7.57 GHVO01011730.1:518-880(+)